MYIASIDCGTTNTRVYIIDIKGNIIGKGVRQVGVRDTTISGNRDLLKDGLKAAFFEALESASLMLDDVSFAISAGMITSEIGLIEIPHIWAPASVEDMAKNLTRVHDTDIFPIDIPIYFIPGIKNKFPAESITIEDINALDFMRGEEVQSAGIIRKNKKNRPITFVILSSHTKFVSINEEGQILGSITTLSGQIYKAIKNATSIGKSIMAEGDSEPENYFDKKIIDTAYRCIGDSGLLRTLMMTRFMDVLVSSKWFERKLFIESAIAAEDMKALERFEYLGFEKDVEMIFIGDKTRCLIYEYILKKRLNWKSDISFISDTDEIDKLNILGSIFILEKAGIINQQL